MEKIRYCAVLQGNKKGVPEGKITATEEVKDTKKMKMAEKWGKSRHFRHEKAQFEAKKLDYSMF